MKTPMKKYLWLPIGAVKKVTNFGIAKQTFVFSMFLPSLISSSLFDRISHGVFTAATRFSHAVFTGVFIFVTAFFHDFFILIFTATFRDAFTAFSPL